MSSQSTNPLDLIPAVKAPPGYTTNLIDPVSKAHTVTTLDAIFTSFMLVAVAIRFFVRARLQKSFGWDDAACILATLGSIAHMIIYTQMVKVGYGRHLWDIPASWLIKRGNVQLLSSNGITYPLTIFFTKVCILLLYVRIFGINRTLRMIVYTTITLMGLFYASMAGVAIGSFVICTGLSQQTNTFCQAYSGPIVLLNGAFNAATDLWILILPFPLLSRLQLRFKQKLGLAAVFAAGIGACAASLARLIGFSKNYRSPDAFWVQATNALFTIVEINIGIIVACVSSFPMFYVRSKSYLHSTTSSMRKRLLSFQELTKSAMSGSFVSLRNKQSRNSDEVNPHVELQHVSGENGTKVPKVKAPST